MISDNLQEEKIKQSLSASWKEGILASIMSGIMDYYLIPFALFLGASTSEIGLLVAIPTLLGAISLLFAVRSLKLIGSRLKFILIGVFLQALFLIPVAFLAYCKVCNWVILLIILITIHKIILNLVSAAWGSLVSEYIAENKRGEYFGWRSQVIGLAGLIGVIIAGLLLYFLKDKSIATGFFILFLSISIGRFLSLYFMAKMADIPQHHSKETDFTFWMFIKRFKESNFVKFVLFTSGVTFATYLAAPYFSVYVLRDLNYSYLTYMILSLSAMIGGLIAFPIWGRHADVVGNAKVLKLTSFLVALTPLYWLISKNPYYLTIVEIFSGFIWGGFMLCGTNFIYDAVVPQKRVRCLAYFNLFNGVALCAGATCGGYLVQYLPPLFGYQILTLFCISSFFRFLAHFILTGHFKEVKAEYKKLRSHELFFSVIGIQPIMGGNRDYLSFPLLLNYLKSKVYKPKNTYPKKDLKS
ncbi:MAG: MFS transporter [Candidatus Melainabacteria bacterium]|nr:MFS transporter [Candidatus Melainabacteria bacterium]